MIKFRTIIIHRLVELTAIFNRHSSRISEGATVTETKRLKKKLKEIQDLIDLNNEFYKLVEKVI